MPEHSSEDNEDDMHRELSEPNSVETSNGNSCMPSSNDENPIHAQAQSVSLPTLPLIAPHTPNNQNNMAALSLAQSMASTNISPTSSALTHIPTPGSLQNMGFMQGQMNHQAMMMNEWQQQIYQQQQNYLGTTKLEEPFEFKPYHYDPYFQQQQFTAATQYPNICQPPHNFEY